MEKIHLAKLLDSTLGSMFTLLDPDIKRKKMYGQAGAIRFKPYGIEYRTLSNYWLSHPHYIKTVFDTAKMMVNYTKKNPEIMPLEHSDFQHINKRNVKGLFENLSKVTAMFPLPSSFTKTYNTIRLSLTPDWKINYTKLNAHLNAL